MSKRKRATSHRSKRGDGSSRRAASDAEPLGQGAASDSNKNDDTDAAADTGDADSVDAETDDDELFGEGADHRRFVIRREAKDRLDRYLQRRLRGISRSRVQKLIELGGVTVNEVKPKASTSVSTGDVIDVILPAPAIRTIDPEPIPLHILYEDDHYIVVNKQAGLIVHPARSHLRGTLINGLAYHFKQQREAAGGEWTEWNTRGFRKTDKREAGASDPSPLRGRLGGGDEASDELVAQQQTEAASEEHTSNHPPLTPPSREGGRTKPASADARGDEDDEDFAVAGLSTVGERECRPGIIHRLDRYTTGVMVVAKSDEAHWAIARQFEKRETTKAYLAVVHGNFEVEGGAIDEPIGKHPTIREAYAVRRDQYGKQSVTLFRVREQYRGYSLVELELKSGRTHQIRVHMTFIGHPLVGDIVYGGEPAGPNELNDPPLALGARHRQMTFARTKEEGVKLEAESAQREDLIIATPALHAALLGFHDPIRDQPVRFTAPLHEPMLSLVRELRKRRVDGPVAKAGYFIDLAAAAPA